MNNKFEIDVTYDCNLSCKWCNRLCGTKFRPLKNNISIEKFQKIITLIEPNINNQAAVRILGGEPTLHPKIFEILDLLVKIIRPKMRFAIDICTNGSGTEVNKILNQIRLRYSTYTLYNEIGSDKRPSSSKEFFIIISKVGPTGIPVIDNKHESIYRAAQDELPDVKDYSKDCIVLKNCGYGINVHGIFICSPAQYIATIFKLKGGLDHLPSAAEEEEQKKLYCRYCYYPRSFLGFKSNEISPSYEKALADWDRDPYFLSAIYDT